MADYENTSHFFSGNNSDERNISSPECKREIEIAGWINLIEGVLTLLFNGIVIMLLARKNNKPNIAILIMHLAITDFAVAILHDFLRAVQLLTDWTYGQPLCILFLYSQQIPLFSSTFIIVSLATDRMVAVWKPFWHGRFRKRTRYGLVLIPWTLAIFLSLPYLKSEVIMSKGKLWCTPIFKNTFGKVWLYIQVSVMFILPAFYIICVYSFIVFLIRNKLNQPITKQMYTNTKSSRSKIYLSIMGITSMSCGIITYRNEGDPNLSQINNMVKAERKSILVTLVVGIAFIVCWLPYSVSIIGWITEVIDLGCSWYLMNALYPLNSLANPIIMITLNYKMFTVNDFRQTLSVKTQLTLLSRKS